MPIRESQILRLNFRMSSGVGFGISIVPLPCKYASLSTKFSSPRKTQIKIAPITVNATPTEFRCEFINHSVLPLDPSLGQAENRASQSSGTRIKTVSRAYRPTINSRQFSTEFLRSCRAPSHTLPRLHRTFARRVHHFLQEFSYRLLKRRLAYHTNSVKRTYPPLIT